MVAARDAQQWVKDGGLHGIGDSLFTPFCGKDGDNIDWDAYRVLVRYCIGDLGHNMLWLTSGCAEWWSLTLDERKRLLEVAVQEARAINPAVVIQACTTAECAKDVAELTLHAQENGADIAFIQTPTMEVHGGEGVKRFFQYVADRTDIALGMFNSNSSGYVMTGEEMAAVHHAVPAVVAVKEGVMDSTVNTTVLHALAPDIAIWECDTLVYEAGWLQQGIVCSGQLGNIAWLYESADNKWFSEYWQLIWDGKLDEARAQRGANVGGMPLSPKFGEYPGRPGYLTHWGEVVKVAASTIGLPVGDYPYSRPPQARLGEAGRKEIADLFVAAGLEGKALTSAAVTGVLESA
jgi:4-hydroxy-tetrahydrodipicolinate synthase